MKNAVILAIGSLISLNLAACSQTPHPGTKAATLQLVVNRQQVSDVVGALESGDVKRARKLLRKMAAQAAGDANVKMLQQSVDGDPVELLGAKSFSYAVQRGDTMQSLAQRFLGDRLRFFLLARYNGFSSARLAQGQVIRVPGVEPTPSPESAPARPRGDLRGPAPAPAPRSSPPAVSVPHVDPVLAAKLRARGLLALNQGRIAVAVQTLRQARAVDPANAAIQRDVMRAERLLVAVRARR